jgi:hypothetical protein
MRHPKHSDPQMAALRAAQRALQARRTELQRAADEALRPLVLAAEDALTAVAEACDVPPGMVLDDARCLWCTRDDGRLMPVTCDEQP